MTIEIEYEAQKETALPYREIIQRVVEAALDDIECPFDIRYRQGPLLQPFE